MCRHECPPDRCDTVLVKIQVAVVVSGQQPGCCMRNVDAGRNSSTSLMHPNVWSAACFSCWGSRSRICKAADLAKQVLRGGAWDGTFASVRSRGSRVSSGPRGGLRNPSGAVDGIVIVGRQATRRSSQQEGERIGLLERIGERLARSLELGLTLQHVPRRWSRSSPTTASSTCSRGTSCSAAPRSTPAAGNPSRAPGRPSVTDRLPGGALLPAGDGPAGSGPGVEPGLH